MDSMEDRSIEHKVDHVDSMEDTMEDRPESPPVTGVLISEKGYEFKSRPEDEKVQQDKEKQQKSGASSSESTEDAIPHHKENKEDSLDVTTARVQRSGSSVVKTPKRPYQSVKGRKCSNCGTEKTTGWKRDAIGSFLCNSCGHYLRSHGTHRASQKYLKNKYDGAVCINCQTTKTYKWKFDKRGPICNACNCYLRTHKVDRPLSLIKEALSKRQRKAKKAVAPGEPLEEESEMDMTSDTTTGDAVTVESNNDDSDMMPWTKKTKAGSSESTNAVAPSSSVVKTLKRLYKSVNGRKCFNCGTEKTISWRRDPTGNSLCNACGQFFKTHGTHRPLQQSHKKKYDGELKRKKRKSKYDGAVCINCQTTETSKWEYDKRGPLCASCHSYLRKHKVDRPLSLKKKIIYRRMSKSKKVTAPGEPLEEESERTMTSVTMTGDAVTVESNNDDSEMMPNSSNDDI